MRLDKADGSCPTRLPRLNELRDELVAGNTTLSFLIPSLLSLPLSLSIPLALPFCLFAESIYLIYACIYKSVHVRLCLCLCLRLSLSLSLSLPLSLSTPGAFLPVVNSSRYVSLTCSPHRVNCLCACKSLSLSLSLSLAVSFSLSSSLPRVVDIKTLRCPRNKAAKWKSESAWRSPCPGLDSTANVPANSGRAQAERQCEREGGDRERTEGRKTREEKKKKDLQQCSCSVGPSGRTL